MLLDLILDILEELIWTDDRIGMYGESLIAGELQLSNLLGNAGKILRNLYVPKDDGSTSEIDLVFLTQKGIFVIESKNYSGWIFGRQYDQYWTQSFPNKTRKRFYNPIRQNHSHIEWLKKYLGSDVPMYSLIVFSERCELKNITLNDESVYVMKRNQLRTYLKKVWEAVPDVLEQATVTQIYEKLLPLTQVDAAKKAAHVSAIRQELSKDRPTPEPSAAEQTQIPKFCTKCGTRLVLRTARYGRYAGNQFLGCPNYPKCNFIYNIPTPDSGNKYKE